MLSISILRDIKPVIQRFNRGEASSLTRIFLCCSLKSLPNRILAVAVKLLSEVNKHGRI